MRRSDSGFTLVELMIVVACIGILASIAIPAFEKNVRRARTSEAIAHLNRLWTGAVSYYESDHADSAGVVVDRQFPTMASPQECITPIEPDCCNPPSGRCPGNAMTYQTRPFVELGFNIPSPHYYRATFNPVTPPPTVCDQKKYLGVGVIGDVDCDGVASVFRRHGFVNSAGDVQSYGGLREISPLE